MAAGQLEFDFDLDADATGGLWRLPRRGWVICGMRLSQAYQVLGFDAAAGGDDVFQALVLARIIEPTSTLDSLRVIEEVGGDPPSYATVKRRLPLFAKDPWRRGLAAACAVHARLGPANLVLYDVSP